MVAVDVSMAVVDVSMVAVAAVAAVDLEVEEAVVEMPGDQE